MLKCGGGEEMEEEREIEELLKQLIEKHDALSYFSSLICPRLEGYETVKKAVLLMLVSDDIGQNRGRIHILLGGEPGTGKSVLIDWLVDEFDALYSDPNTTRVGLTADASRGNLSPGLLAKANGKILCIDEMEFLKDRDALRESMEKGYYKIAKGKFEHVFEAKVRVVGALNEIDKLSQPLRDRFDFEFSFKKPTPDESIRVSQKLLESYFYDDEYRNVEILKAFVEWTKKFRPKLMDMEEARGVFEQYFRAKNEGKTGRWIASIIRIAIAIAKVYHRDVKKEDFVKAIKLKEFNGMFL